MEETRTDDGGSAGRAVDWNAELLDQLEFHWEHQLRPRLDGLTDEEYFWEPVENCWSLRPAAESRTPMAVGAGTHLLDYAYPQPAPVPVTTIAWRMAHIEIAVFRKRLAGHFGGPPIDYDTAVYATTAAQALEQLDEAYEAWRAGVRSLGEKGLAEPAGPAEGPFAHRTMATLVLHIHRETIHHGAEISLLRDLYENRG
ncbi:DinB family protein [Streptomyces sp. ODS28]|uniref:DinB family protein n=1 Tax=Streptomyces sp. ODS28 TaxID=3136688 RepID=UPI0031E83BA2